MNQSKKNLRLSIFIIFILFLLQFIAVPFAESVTYTYDDANRLIQEEDSTGTTNEYTYDDAGNLIQKNGGSGGITYTGLKKRRGRTLT
jgi:YD repeat-containing protein